MNQDNRKLEYQKPIEYQEFDYNDEMYKIVLEDGSDLLVSEKHKVYVGKNYQIFPAKKSFTKSNVVSTGANDCSLRCGSLDQIAELFDNASARYGESLGSDKFLIAFVSNSSYADSSKNSIASNISFCLISNSCIESFDLDKHNSLYLPISSFTNSGAINSALIEENKYEDIDNGFISENNMLLSNTSIILVYLYSSLFSGDIEFSNSSLLFLGNFESNFLNESSFAFLPNSTDHLTNSCSSEELNLFSNSCLLNSSCLTNSDQTTQTNLDNLAFNLSSIANVTDAIYSFPLDFNSSTFSSSSSFLIITLRATSATFTSGNSFLNLANNSSGICTVILNDLAILTPCSIYFNESNYFSIYKSFGEKDLSEFSLQEITEIYQEINEKDKEIYFLNSENKPVKIKSIEKQAYNGKIYDVDVENDVVLVRRRQEKKEIIAGPTISTSNNFNNKNSDLIVSNIKSNNSILNSNYKNDLTANKFDDYNNIKNSINLDNKINEQEASSFSSVDEQEEFGIAVWSGNSNNGSKQGNAAQTDAGYFGKGFEFDGNGDYVDAGNIDNLLFSSDFAISVWVYHNVDNTDFIWGKGTSSTVTSEFFIRANSGYEFRIDQSEGADVDTVNAVPVNTWQHVVVTRVGSDLAIYINGNKTVNVSNSENGSSTGSFFIGGSSSSPGVIPWEGTIDDVMIFNRSLSAEEILALYANTSSRYLTNNFTGLSEGEHTFKAYTQDLAGNVNSTETKSVTTDATAPLVTIVSPENITYSTTTIPFNFTLNEAGYCEYSLNSGVTNYTMTANSSNTGFNATNSSIADGSYTVNAYCNDTAGNRNDTTIVTFSKDTTAPVVTIISPENNSNFNASSIIFNVSLNETGSWCGLSIDSEPNVTMTLNSSLTGANYTNTSIADGSYTFQVSCNDTANNYGNSGLNYFLIDTIFPDINFTSPTPSNGSTQSTTNIFVNVSASDTNNISTFIDFDNSLVGWWRMDDVNASGDPTDISGHCYDNETQILTENGWKFFYDLNKNEKVATLNQDNRKLEYQKPIEYQEFDYDDEMYNILLEDGSDFLVSKKHKVYAAINQNLSSISLGDKTFDGSSFLSTLSPEKIGQSNLSESARYCTSFKCEESNFLASGKNSEKSDLGINVICSNMNSNISSNSCLGSLVLLENSSLCFSNSVNENSGARNLNLLNKLFIEKMLNESPLPNNDERITLTSTTTSMLYKYLFDSDVLILSDNSSTSFSDNCDLLTILCNRAILSNLDFITLLTNIDQSMFGTCLTNFNSSGILMQISSIKETNPDTYKKLSVGNFSLQKITDVYKDINEKGKEIYFLNSENKPVKIKSIEKQRYNGKIYDVDVENDIILVRRKNSSAVWSGNSNNGAETTCRLLSVLQTAKL